jgi:hypothetical protein
MMNVSELEEDGWQTQDKKKINKKKLFKLLQLPAFQMKKQPTRSLTLRVVCLFVPRPKNIDRNSVNFLQLVLSRRYILLAEELVVAFLWN